MFFSKSVYCVFVLGAAFHSRLAIHTNMIRSSKALEKQNSLDDEMSWMSRRYYHSPSIYTHYSVRRLLITVAENSQTIYEISISSVMSDLKVYIGHKTLSCQTICIPTGMDTDWYALKYWQQLCSMHGTYTHWLDRSVLLHIHKAIYIDNTVYAFVLTPTI